MLAIINGDKKNPIKITSGTYDYTNSVFHLKNCNPEEQTKEMIDYIRSLKNVQITSLEIQRNNHDFLDGYEDLNAKILNFEKHMSYQGESVTTVLTIYITNMP